MKFFKDVMLPGMVAEWIPKYLDYKLLKEKIKAIKSKALKLAEAWNNIGGNTDIVTHFTVLQKSLVKLLLQQ